ncbi:MAG: hypothetical protein CMJ64_07585 [Planctomycetaceae bacterium]|nr:hypothetical protein [Planctomycetaceae bacterium]
MRRRPTHAGLTLVELLIATTLTLMLVAAVTQAFQVVGTSIAVNRATVEMVGELRSVGVRLQNDLEGLTVAARPWPEAASGQGYIEYEEGWAHDGWLFPGNLGGTPTPGVTHYGDADDVLMFTSRTRDAPFVGVYQVRTGPLAGTLAALGSTLVEVVWWATLTDVDRDGSPNPNTLENETYVLLRRALLIRPDLNTLVEPAFDRRYFAVFPPPSSSLTWYTRTSQTHLRELRGLIKSFVAQNDLSVRLERQNNPGSPNQVRIYVVCNSLDDLTKPENRFAHSPIIRVAASSTTTPPTLEYVPQAFPFRIDHDDARDSVTRLPSTRLAFSTPAADEPGMIKSGDQQGEDVLLDRVLAFDVRAYDPLAFVGAHPGRDGVWGSPGDDDSSGTADDIGEAGWPRTDDELVTPGDPGFSALPTDASLISLSSTGRAVLPVSRGAYVDLAYTLKWIRDDTGDHSYNLRDGLAGTSYPNPLAPPGTSPADVPAGFPPAYYSHFSGMPQSPAAGFGTGLPRYDTWTFHYERDGLNQDRDAFVNSAGTLVPLIDEGTDGFDLTSWVNSTGNTQTANPSRGVDDVGERETAPPYPVPLRGLQVKIRLFDPATRQIRQITVVSDFTPR